VEVIRMKKWMFYLMMLARDRRADFAQYALLMALIVVVAVGVLTGLGQDITSTLNSVRSAF